MGRTRWFPFVFVSLLAAAPYLTTPGFDFVFDDRHLIVHNAFLRQAASPFTAFAHHFWHGTPYGAAYYALNGRILGWGPMGFHLINILLHAGNAMLMLVLARRLGCPAPAALGAALLFAVHPVAAWPVASVVARVDLLPAFFILLAWLETARPGRSAALASLLFLLALLSKESSAAFLGVPILAMRRMTEAVPERPDRRLALALAAAVALYLLMRRAAGLGLFVHQASIDPLINPLGVRPPAERLPAAAALAGRYCLYLLLPLRFRDPSNYMSHAAFPGPLDPGVVLSVAVPAVLVSWVVILWLRRDRIALPLGFAIASFLPAANLVVPIASLYAQNFLYLPLAGLALALGIAIGRGRPAWLWQTPVKVAVGTLLLPALGIAAYGEARIWKDEVALFTAFTERFPYYLPAQSGLGVALLDRGRPREALGPLRAALALSDASVEAHYNLAVALILTARSVGDREEALTHIRRVIAMRPLFAPAHAQAARALMVLGREAEAEAEGREAVRLDPDLSPEIGQVLGQKKTTGP